MYATKKERNILVKLSQVQCSLRSLATALLLNLALSASGNTSGGSIWNERKQRLSKKTGKTRFSGFWAKIWVYLCKCFFQESTIAVCNSSNNH